MRNLFIIALCLCFVECKNVSKTDTMNGSVDSVIVVPSSSVEKVDEAIKTIDDFLSPDRKMLNFRGKVASCITYAIDAEKNGEKKSGAKKEKTQSILFSEAGLLTQYGEGCSISYDKKGNFVPNRKSIIRCVRNPQKQLIQLYYEETEMGQDKYEFEYNENGTLNFDCLYSSESCWGSNYEYGENGQIAKQINFDGYDGMRTEKTYTFDYKGIDDHGNWINRLACVSGEYFIEEREITYYE